jgi:hypothetical protein
MGCQEKKKKEIQSSRKAAKNTIMWLTQSRKGRKE